MKHLKYLPHGLAFLSEPFEVFLGFVAVLSGTLYWTGLSQSAAVDKQLSHWQLDAWMTLFTAGGVLILLSRGLIARAKTLIGWELGARIEALGCTVFGGAATMYAMSVFAVGRAGFFGGVTISAWAVASFVRTYIVIQQWKPTRRDRKGALDD